MLQTNWEYPSERYQYGVLPFRVDETTLTIVSADPFDTAAEGGLTFGAPTAREVEMAELPFILLCLTPEGREQEAREQKKLLHVTGAVMWCGLDGTSWSWCSVLLCLKWRSTLQGGLT